ncbi:hypothetical protein CDAR_615751 [Caerostris darwini]|uniref:Uncharacterized protein n=1 Tax=Caerostris darwini TaxID=1538125 RepID=A0AAV4RZH9_9ARAC|nr:hypothetical protein CDAR_615751 [Caerostris darwini]
MVQKRSFAHSLERKSCVSQISIRIRNEKPYRLYRTITPPPPTTVCGTVRGCSWHRASEGVSGAELAPRPGIEKVSVESEEKRGAEGIGFCMVKTQNKAGKNSERVRSDERMGGEFRFSTSLSDSSAEVSNQSKGVKCNLWTGS